MRPILLKIKGLNSFIEEQSIDFEKLMEPGLFGIFGPTGSGKTTILDGITLALYGEIARKSKNFVNTNCKTASVCFEFQITGAEIKRYRVEREFKQDPAKEGYKTGKCRLSDITGEEPVILADKVTDINNKCIEIIGLKADDFQRTVVLPQGRFSEFLKLEGKKRSEMLERLFRLQPYGDGLMRKLKEKSDAISHEKANLQGRLSTYVDVTAKVVEDTKQKVATLEQSLATKTQLLKKVEEEYQESKIVWDLQEEQKRHLERKATLEGKETEMSALSDNIELSEKAEKVIPYIQALEKSQADAKKLETNLIHLKRERDHSEQEKLNAETLWEKWKKIRDEELPKVRINIQAYKDAIGFQKEYLQLKTKKEACVQQEQQKTKDAEVLKRDEADHENKITVNSANIEKLQEKQKKFEVSAEVRQQVLEGSTLEREVHFWKGQIEEETKKEEALKKDIQQQEEKLSSYKKILFADQEVPSLTEYQDELYALKEKKKNYTEFIMQLEQKEKEKQLTQTDFEQSRKQMDLLEQELCSLQEKKEAIEMESLALQLRIKLQDGTPCPVCGSTHYEMEHLENIDISQLEQIKVAFQKKQLEVRETEKIFISKQSEYQRQEKDIEELKRNILELESLVKDVSEQELEEKLKILPQYQQVKASLTVLCGNFTEQQKKCKQLIEEQKEREMIWQEKLEKVPYDSFEEAAEKLQRCDELCENIKQALIDGIALTERLKKEQVEIKEKLYGMEKELVILQENSKFFTQQLTRTEEKFQQSLKDVELCSIETLSLSDKLITYQEREMEIERAFVSSEEKKDEVMKKHVILQEQYVEMNSAYTHLQKQIESESDKVTELLLQEKFISKEDCRQALLSLEEKEEMRVVVEAYKKDCVENAGFLKQLATQLAGKFLSEEQWNKVVQIREQETTDLEELKISYNNEKQNCQRIVAAWNIQKELQEEMKQIEHQESLMADLQQLFRGKKFVEFVAYSKLQYISKAASHRLREISNGNYGLEIDTNGKFLICDYKNGGVKRDAFTLSGGETFLVSLSLSLALSEQVQLKGTAPLELFFLDEGFGTLDDELLEVVMTSLERIQNKYLTVGIISHVEAVKNRVPIKLIVSPSVAGLGGTKVKIEKN